MTGSRRGVRQCEKASASRAAHGERAPVSWAKITVADFGGTGVSDCAVGNTARDTSGSNPSLSTIQSRQLAGALAFSRTGNPATGEFQDAVILAQFGEVDLDSLSE